jgi:ribonuclease D
LSYTVVTNSSALQKCLDTLLKKDRIAIDLEFDKNRYRYGFNLCLMQIFDGTTCYLIDPLSSDLDISIIFPVLESEDIQKVVFAFGEDIRLLYHIGCKPANIYDLTHASALLDYPPSSLTNLADEVLNVDLGKSSQQSNWFIRPLTDDQLQYAANDVLYLFDLMEVLDAAIQEKGMSTWLHQENEAFTHADYSNENHNQYLKEKDKGDLSEYDWHIFKQLMEFREEKAASVNRPSYHVLDKNYLADLAADPSQLRRWKKVSNMYRDLKNDAVQQRIKELIERAKDEAEHQNLSKTPKSARAFDQEQYQRVKQEKHHLNVAKQHCFKPMQKHLEERFGKNTQIFILNNRMIKELVTGELQNYLPYKKDLFEDIAEEYDLPLDEYIGSFKSENL